MSSSSFSWLRNVSFPKRNASAKMKEEKKHDEKKAFTEPESIRIPAMYNRHQIKSRKSFTVEADCIMQEGEIVGRVSANDPSAKVGCVLKPTNDMREAMKVSAHGVQTWHRRASYSNSSSSRLSSSASSNRISSASTRRNSDGSRARSNSSGSVVSGPGIRTYFVVEEGIEALEEVADEMKNLKQVIADAEKFENSRDLSRAIARLAAKKKATLREKLSLIEFEGDGQHIFYKLKEKLTKSLDRMTVDWSEGGLNLTPGQNPPQARTTSARRGSVGRTQSERPWARNPENRLQVSFGGSMHVPSSTASSGSSLRSASSPGASSGAGVLSPRGAKSPKSPSKGMTTVRFTPATHAQKEGAEKQRQQRLSGEVGLKQADKEVDPKHAALLKELEELRNKHAKLEEEHETVKQRFAEALSLDERNRNDPSPSSASAPSSLAQRAPAPPVLERPAAAASPPPPPAPPARDHSTPSSNAAAAPSPSQSLDRTRQSKKEEEEEEEEELEALPSLRLFPLDPAPTSSSSSPERAIELIASPMPTPSSASSSSQNTPDCAPASSHAPAAPSPADASSSQEPFVPKLKPVAVELGNPFAKMPNPYANAKHLRVWVAPALSRTLTPSEKPEPRSIERKDVPEEAQEQHAFFVDCQVDGETSDDAKGNVSPSDAEHKEARGLSARVFVGSIDVDANRVVKRNGQPVLRPVTPRGVE